MRTGTATLAADEALSVGLRVAFAVGYRADRTSGVRAVAHELSRAFDVAVAAWRVAPDGRHVVLVSDHRLLRGQHDALASETATWVLGGAGRRHRLDELGDTVRRLMHAREVTIVDVTCAVVVLGRRCPEVDAARHQLAALLLRLPDTEAPLEEAPTLLDGDQPAATETLRLASLTPREREVLVLLEGGEGTGVIARHLAISRNTVKTHVHNILAKLDVGSRLEAAALARRRGLLADPIEVPHQLHPSE